MEDLLATGHRTPAGVKLLSCSGRNIRAAQRDHRPEPSLAKHEPAQTHDDDLTELADSPSGVRSGFRQTECARMGGVWSKYTL